MEEHVPHRGPARRPLVLGAVIATASAAFWAFVGLEDEGWSTPALAAAFAVIAGFFIYTLFRLRA